MRFHFDFVYSYVYVLSFFFQAEDGIRDGRVTGVQTCALPISRGPTASPTTAPASANNPPTSAPLSVSLRPRARGGGAAGIGGVAGAAAVRGGAPSRSGEGGGGREGGAWGGAGRLKKKRREGWR